MYITIAASDLNCAVLMQAFNRGKCGSGQRATKSSQIIHVCNI